MGADGEQGAVDAGRYLALKDLGRLVPGNRVALLRDGLDAFPEMLSAIRAARSRVRLETYIFSDDAVGRAFSQALGDAAARGVRVTVLYDAVGSLWTPRAFFRRLRASGVDVHAFRPIGRHTSLRRLIRRDHRKLLVVDSRVAFVGGINIAVQWAPRGVPRGGGWRDDALRIEGPAAAALERRFFASWRVAVRERLRAWRSKPPLPDGPPAGSLGLAILSSRRAIHRAYLHALEAAERSVLVAAGYFVPDVRVLHALEQAAARGVEVKLLLAGRSDHAVMTWAARGFYRRLLRAGVRVFEWSEGVLHAKTAVVDGRWATVGSFNLEAFSLLYNHEVNVALVEPAFASQVEASLRRDLSACREVTLESLRRRPRWRRALEAATWMLRKLL
ncbi:MAG: hypothetical protein RL653_3485 [Pseudomonadota bacterium]|jgi:cardiolipin synthase